jgi:hypothetical protein
VVRVDSETHSSSEAPQAKQRGTTLELAGRTLGLWLGVIYATGFIVVLLHQSQFGIVEFSPLKPRIFTAGILLLLFVSIPAVAIARVYALFGMRSSIGFSISAKAENMRYLNIALGAGFYIPCHYLASSLGFLFPGIQGFHATKPLGDWVAFGFVCIFLLGGIISAKDFDKHPRQFTILEGLLAVGWFLTELLYMARLLLWLTLWFYSVALVSLFLIHWARSSKDRIVDYPWERMGLVLLFVFFLFFTRTIYTNVAASFGGGASIPATFHFLHKGVIGDSEVVNLLVLDETDHGFYVLVPPDSTRAYFVRRDLVSSIHFGQQEINRAQQR